MIYSLRHPMRLAANQRKATADLFKNWNAAKEACAEILPDSEKSANSTILANRKSYLAIKPLHAPADLLRDTCSGIHPRGSKSYLRKDALRPELFDVSFTSASK